jgi:uncharacterized membrane protein
MSTPTRPAPPAQLEWLQAEVADWQREGLISQEQSAALLGRYHEARRGSLARLLVVLGAIFVGFGLIWLVASNLDELPPTARFAVVALIWVAVTVAAELLAVRRAHGGPIPSPVVHAGRLLASLLFGAVVFQAAQSLQVPAYEPRLVGLWAAGALLHGYAVRAAAPVVLGVVAGLVWVVWQAAWDEPSALGIVLAVAAAGVAAISVAALHDRFPLGDGSQDLAWPWRATGSIALLGALFAAAIPFLTLEDFVLTPWLGVMLGVAVVLVVAAVALTRGSAQRWVWLEPLGALVVTVLAVLLLAWEAGSEPDEVGLLDWLHAAVSVLGYLVVSAGIAALGVLRDRSHLTAIAVVALVAFTTFQSFAVFAEIIQGAWLFLFMGLVLGATGWLADRARRELAEQLGDLADPTTTGGVR